MALTLVILTRVSENRRWRPIRRIGWRFAGGSRSRRSLFIVLQNIYTNTNETEIESSIYDVFGESVNCHDWFYRISPCVFRRLYRIGFSNFWKHFSRSRQPLFSPAHNQKKEVKPILHAVIFVATGDFISNINAYRDLQLVTLSVHPLWDMPSPRGRRWDERTPACVCGVEQIWQHCLIVCLRTLGGSWILRSYPGSGMES